MRGGEKFFLEAGFISLTILSVVLFGSVYPWISWSESAFLFLLLFCYPGAVLEARRLPRIFLLGISSIFPFLLVQVFFTSYNPSATGDEVLKWLAWTSGFLLIQRLPRISLSRWMTVLVLLGTLESVYGLLQVASVPEMVLWQKKEAHLGFVTGTYLNRNHLAGLLELCLGVHVGYWLLAFRKGNLRAVLGWGVLLVISLTAFLKTGSRAGVASWILSLSFFSLFLWKKPAKSSSLFFLALIFLGLFALFAGWGTLTLRFMDRAEEGRFWVWRDALGILQRHPLLGSGLGTFEWVFPLFQSGKLLMGWAHAHNDYLELATELGIPAFLVFFVSFLSLWIDGVRRLGTLSETDFPVVWGSLISVTSLLLHGFVDFNLAIPANAMILIFLTGTTIRFLEPSHAKESF